MCLGCLQRCPKAAIQYGNGVATGKHGQYRNPHVTVYKQLFLPHSGNKKTSARRCGSTCFITGADNRSRTYDLLITNELLYQLSYVGVDSE